MFDILTGAPLQLTLKVSAISVLLQFLVGIPMGLFIAGRSSPLRRIVDILTTLPMIFPPMALGFFLLLLLGKNGLFGAFLLQVFGLRMIFTFWGILFAAFIVGLPFMVKSVQAARRQMDETIVEAAATLGKSPMTILLRVILPNIRGGVITGLLLAFGRSLGEVGISLILGGNIIGRTETLSLAIYNAVFDGDFQLAARLSILLSLLAIAVILLLNGTHYRSFFLNVIHQSRLHMKRFKKS
jgi:molybdate transport system permease protein